MKYLFLLVVVLVVVWAIQRTKASGPSKPPSPPDATPSEMVTCPHCGVHLPQEEAVAGQKGLYCSTEHRAAAQDRNPG